MRNIDTWFVDLDGTLYPSNNGLLDAVIERIIAYTGKVAGLSGQAAHDLAWHYHNTYGNTLIGLMRVHGVDPREFLTYAHDVPVRDYIPAPDPILRSVLDALPGYKVILTNSIRAHAVRVLDALGVLDRFEDIIDTLDQLPNPKPAADAFHNAMRIAGASDPTRCGLIDDSASATKSAKALGMFTVLVCKRSIGEGEADLVIPTIHALGDLAGK